MVERVSALANAHDYEQALAAAHAAVEWASANLGADDPLRASALQSLGAVYMRMGNYRIAEPHLKKAVEIARRTLGESHPAYGRSLRDLGSAYYEMGDIGSAESLLRKAVEVLATDTRHRFELALALGSLALLHQSVGDIARAEPLLERAVGIVRSEVGQKDPHRVAPLMDLAQIHADKHQYRAAEELYREALEMLDGEEGPVSATCLSNLGVLYQMMHDYWKADQYLSKATDMRRRTLGERHPDYVIGLVDLAQFRMDVGDYDGAETTVSKSGRSSENSVAVSLQITTTQWALHTACTQ